METVCWTEAMSVGVARIDEQHKRLVEMINELGQAIGAGRGQAAMRDIVGCMRLYAQEHFRTEEEAMGVSRFPGRTSHVSEHDAFIELVQDLEAALDQGGVVSATATWRFLWDWLANHIQGPDKVLGDHLCACGRD